MVCAIGRIHNGLNTLRPGQNGRHFADDSFKYILLNENVWISIEVTLKYVRKGPINNIPALVQIMAWRRPGDKPLSEPMMVSLLTHICVTRPQWVKVVFCFRHVTPSHYRYALLFQEEPVNVNWVHSLESVSKIWLVLSITFFNFLYNILNYRWSGGGGVTARFVTRFNLWLRHDLWPHNASICDPARFVTKSASICDQRHTIILESKLCRGRLVFVFTLIMYTKWYNMIIYIWIMI